MLRNILSLSPQTCLFAYRQYLMDIITHMLGVNFSDFFAQVDLLILRTAVPNVRCKLLESVCLFNQLSVCHIICPPDYHTSNRTLEFSVVRVCSSDL